MGVKSSLRFVGQLMATNIQQSMALKGAFVIEMLFMMANNLMMIVGWVFLFGHFKEINGWSIHDYILMEAIAVIGYSVYPVFFRGLGDSLAGYIERGELDNFLLQPRNVLIQAACSRSSPSGFGELLTGIVLLFLCGIVTLGNFPIILLSCISASVVFIAVTLFSGSLAFYITEAEGWVNQIMNIFLAIVLKPASIYTGVFKIFLIYIFPACVISLLPIEAVKNPNLTTIALLIILPIVFLTLAIAFFYHGLKRYESGNRFGVRA